MVGERSAGKQEIRFLRQWKNSIIFRMRWLVRLAISPVTWSVWSYPILITLFLASWQLLLRKPAINPGISFFSAHPAETQIESASFLRCCVRTMLQAFWFAAVLRMNLCICRRMYRSLPLNAWSKTYPLFPAIIIRAVYLRHKSCCSQAAVSHRFYSATGLYRISFRHLCDTRGFKMLVQGTARPVRSIISTQKTCLEKTLVRMFTKP